MDREMIARSLFRRIGMWAVAGVLLVWVGASVEEAAAAADILIKDGRARSYIVIPEGTEITTLGFIK